jgi:hypothetical protein
VNYLRALYHGNPAAFSFLAAMCGFLACAAWHSRDRLLNEEFDAYMERIERDRWENEQRARRKEIEQLEKMWR